MPEGKAAGDTHLPITAVVAACRNRENCKGRQTHVQTLLCVLCKLQSYSPVTRPWKPAPSHLLPKSNSNFGGSVYFLP